MQVLHVASEIAPWSQTGGLAQVLGSLPRAQAQVAGLEVAVFAPLHRMTRRRVELQKSKLDEISAIEVIRGEYRAAFRIHELSTPGPERLFFLECDELFDREGLYVDEHGNEHPDNPARFALFCHAALELAPWVLEKAPELLHCHDWQASLAPVFARLSDAPWTSSLRSLLTIHNIAFQGRFEKDWMRRLEIPWSWFTFNRLEHYDDLNMLKGGVAACDAVSTVSPSFAQEVLTPEFGCQLDEFLGHHAPRLTGILNGLDTDEWNPRSDPRIAAPFNSRDMSGKARCKAELEAVFGLPPAPEALLLGMVSRFDHQKGLDLVIGAVPELERIGARLVLLGSGDPSLEEQVRDLCAAFPESLSAKITYDTALAHKVFAGSDALLMPSRFEPCGLAQLSAMSYGTIPVVNAVGGLRDTVRDSEQGRTGFVLDELSVAGLTRTLERVHGEFVNDPTAWAATQNRAMAQDWSWASSAVQYAELYKKLSS